MLNYCAHCFVKKTLRTATLLGLTIVALNLNFSGAWNGLAEPQQSAAAPASSISPERLTLMLEALKRLPADQVQKNPALTQKVRSLAEAAADRPEYLELVRKFKIPGQMQPLSQIAVAQSGENSGAEAVRLLFMLESENWWQDVLEKTPVQDRAAWALALKNAADPQALDALEWILTEPESEPAAMKSAVQGMVRFQKGAERVLALAETQKLPASVRLLSSSLLNDVTWESIQTRAREILPLPPTKDPQPLPPISELIQRKGNVELGKAVFLRAESLCAICHIAEDQGADFGPALSEIGAKLGKDALYPGSQRRRFLRIRNHHPDPRHWRQRNGHHRQRNRPNHCSKICRRHHSSIRERIDPRPLHRTRFHDASRTSTIHDHTRTRRPD